MGMETTELLIILLGLLMVILGAALIYLAWVNKQTAELLGAVAGPAVDALKLRADQVLAPYGTQLGWINNLAATVTPSIDEATDPVIARLSGLLGAEPAALSAALVALVNDVQALTDGEAAEAVPLAEREGEDRS